LGEHALAPVEEIIGHVLTETDYRGALLASDTPEDQERLANLEELLTDAREFDEQHPGGGRLEAFLERSALVSDTDAWQADADRVTLMTLHAAKGLEFPVVFITAVEQGILPHERAKNELESDEEERRLLFVGITRACHELQLSLVRHRAYRGIARRAIPSQFLMELPRHEMEVLEPFAQNVAREYHPDADPFADVEAIQDGPAVSSDWEANPVSASSCATAADMLDADHGRRRISPAAAAAATDCHGPVDPDAFRVGMVVIHPEHGLGKVAALSGVGSHRTVTVNFAVGPTQRKFVVIHSALRPAGSG
jgi:DNA helicase-2/ATP-dependent DNA helicase PcrA